MTGWRITFEITGPSRSPAPPRSRACRATNADGVVAALRVTSTSVTRSPFQRGAVVSRSLVDDLMNPLCGMRDRLGGLGALTSVALPVPLHFRGGTVLGQEQALGTSSRESQALA